MVPNAKGITNELESVIMMASLSPIPTEPVRSRICYVSK